MNGCQVGSDLQSVPNCLIRLDFLPPDELITIEAEWKSTFSAVDILVYARIANPRERRDYLPI